MNEPLDQMLRAGTSTLFQPIFDVRSERFSAWGVEALTRGPAGTHFEPAPIFFDYIRLKHEEARTDRWCIAAAFARYAMLTSEVRLSVNVHATTLERDSGFVSFVESAALAAGLDPSRIIIEIIEQAPYFDTARLVSVVQNLRSLGVGIAVDDVGVGHGNLRTILDTHPDYLKIDRYFVAGCARDPRRRSLIEMTVRMAGDLGATVIGEGVEDPDDLGALRDIGVPLMQGYLLAMPDPWPRLDPIGPSFALPLDRKRA